MSDLLTVSEAAKVAGVSVRTIRRWATSGQVRTVGHGHGRRIVAASLSEPAANVDTNGHEKWSAGPTISATADTETANGHEAGHLANLVRELSDRLAEQTAMTALWMERARVLGDQLALAAPQSPPEAPGAPEPPDPTTEPSAPWWRRWRAWLATGLVVAVVGSASCQTVGVAASRQHLCPAAHQQLAVFDRLAGNRRVAALEDRWLPGPDWTELTTVAAFITTYC